MQLRDFRLKLGAPLPALWSKSEFATYYFNALSASFPLGEGAFVRSAKFYLDDPRIAPFKDDVLIFLKQEGFHSREHASFNRLLAQQGYDIAKMERFLKRFIDINKFAPPLSNLAVTVCLEHFTAIFSRAVLRFPEMLGTQDENIFSLWAWHCLEELEHKSIAMDIYRAVGGSYPMRACTMALVTCMFFVEIFGIFLIFLKHDRKLFKLPLYLKGLWFLFGNPGFLRRVLPDYMAFYRPSFHPAQDDDSSLLQAYDSRLQKYYRRSA